MTRQKLLVSLLCTGLLAAYLPDIRADEATDAAAKINALQAQDPCSYGQKVREKFLRTMTNLSFGGVEIPKNIVNVTNDSNIFFGLTGGLLKGLVNTLGRTAVGVTDLLTLPVPTQPVAYPIYVWDEFDTDTRYDSLFRSDSCPPNDTVIATPEAMPPAARPEIIVPSRPVPDNLGQNNSQTNRKLDTLFKRQMTK
jgi:putative exosortase-associated protein (TIGR04073 family)